eukprot:SAG31_NODE_13679_length_853_cov_1.721485_1_plen_147_part_10
MNSLLQSLFLTPELRYALYQWRYTAGRDGPREKCIPYQLQRLFIDLQTSDKRTVETKALTTSFGWNSGQQYQQQDVSELFNVLFEALEKSFKEVPAFRGVIKALYEGSVKDYVKCTVCGTESAQVQPFKALNCKIRPFGAAPISSVH